MYNDDDILVLVFFYRMIILPIDNTAMRYKSIIITMMITIAIFIVTHHCSVLQLQLPVLQVK